MTLINLVPVMSSYNMPSGEVSSSSEPYPGVFPSYGAFNHSRGDDGWFSKNDSNVQWIQYKFNAPVTISRYILTSSGRILPDFTLEGSNDGISYYVIDTQTGQLFNGDYGTNVYDVSPATWTYFRLVRYSNPLLRYMVIRELEFMGSDTPSVIPRVVTWWGV